jgi:hypothetical protein
MSIFNVSGCYKACSDTYAALNPGRLFCKKACDSDEGIPECKTEYCSKLCIKQQLGDDDEKKPEWSKFFARAPSDANSEECLNACIFGCTRKDSEEDD